LRNRVQHPGGGIMGHEHLDYACPKQACEAVVHVESYGYHTPKVYCPLGHGIMEPRAP